LLKITATFYIHGFAKSFILFCTWDFLWHSPHCTTTLFTNSKQERSCEKKNEDHLLKHSFLWKEATRMVTMQNTRGYQNSYYAG